MDGITIIPGSSFSSPHQNRVLPTPDEVRAVNANEHDAFSDRPPIVCYDHLGLVVKYGRDVSVAEARTQMMVRSELGHQVPAPEVFAWGSSNGEMFIYIALVEGDNAEDRRPDMEEGERQAVCAELRFVARLWRLLGPHTSSPGEP